MLSCVFFIHGYSRENFLKEIETLSCWVKGQKGVTAFLGGTSEASKAPPSPPICLFHTLSFLALLSFFLPSFCSLVGKLQKSFHGISLLIHEEDSFPA